jgi:arginine-tRNA-protein transferase
MSAFCTGFYIHTCPKMKYKADYQPSFLLDPETNKFYPWAHAKERLDITKHASFSKPVSQQPMAARETTPALSDSASSSPGSSVDDEDVEWPETPPPGCLDPSRLPKELLFGTCVLEGRTLVPLLVSEEVEKPELKVCC